MSSWRSFNSNLPASSISTMKEVFGTHTLLTVRAARLHAAALYLTDDVISIFVCVLAFEWVYQIILPVRPPRPAAPDPCT